MILYMQYSISVLTFSFICIRDKYTTRYTFISDAVDIIIPSAGLGWLKADEGIVGLAG